MNKDRMLDELSVLQERFANGMGWRDGEYEEALDEAIELINQMPSADVVVVVRCNDCKNYNAKENKAYIAFCPVAEGIETIEPTDYCCWGERKGSDE